MNWKNKAEEITQNAKKINKYKKFRDRTDWKDLTYS